METTTKNEASSIDFIEDLRESEFFLRSNMLASINSLKGGSDAEEAGCIGTQIRVSTVLNPRNQIRRKDAPAEAATYYRTRARSVLDRRDQSKPSGDNRTRN